MEVQGAAAKALSALPTMVPPPTLTKAPPLVLPHISSPRDTLEGSEHAREFQTGNPPPAVFNNPLSGPVFPGQISPRAKISSNPPVADSFSPKRIKTENSVTSQQNSANPDQSGARQNISVPPGSQGGNNVTSAQSRRKALPVKRESDQSRNSTSHGNAFNRRPEETISPPSFEGFGTSDFNSIGILPAYLRNAVDYYGNPIFGNLPAAPPPPRQVERAPFPSPFPSGHVRVKQEPLPVTSSCAYGQPTSFALPSQTSGRMNHQLPPFYCQK